MIAEIRHRKLLEALERSGAVSVAEASKLLRVSRMTVHRDLESLSAAGRLRKVHGGAVALDSRLPGRDAARPFDERKPEAARAKRQIARHLAKLVAGARTLALDASSTVYGLAQSISEPPRNGSDGPFILTNGIPLFLELQRRNVGFRLALTGGEPHRRTGSLIGPLAVKSLEGLRFDMSVVSAAGLADDHESLYDLTPEGAALKHALLSRGTVRVLAMDSSKFGALAPYPLGSLKDFDVLVTEDGIKELKGRRKALASG